MPKNKKLFKSLFYLLILILLSLVLYFEDSNQNNIQESKVKFSELPGWSSTNILASLQSFEQSCKYVMNEQFLEENKLLEVKIKTDAYIKFCKSLPTVTTNSKLKKLIEDNFYARYLPSKKTLFTGYIELEIKGRLEKSITEAPNAIPIFKKPPNILSVNLEKFGEEYKAKKITGMIINNDFIPVPSRKIIENEHLFKDHILAYIDDPALAYFLHIQGSGVITLKSGEKLSVGYAGDNGKNYYSIGKELIEEGIIKKEDMSMQAILVWMRNNKLAALELMQKNKRFIFFKERNNLEPPKGSSGTSVTAMHSAAVDNNFIPYHLPLWIQVDDFYNDRPDKRLTNIFISQDTGSAIKGLTRMDLFLGKGINAEEIAGRLSSNGKIWTLVPK
ncbi:MAG: MltA domain-containing protein [Alphaproteobacteria bacterium]